MAIVCRSANDAICFWTCSTCPRGMARSRSRYSEGENRSYYIHGVSYHRETRVRALSRSVDYEREVNLNACFAWVLYPSKFTMSVRELIERDSSVLDVNKVSGCVSGLQATQIYESMDQNFFQRSFGSSLTPVIYGPKVEDNYLPSINFVPPCPPAMLTAPIRYFNEDLIGNPVKNQVANLIVNQQRPISVPAPAVQTASVQTKKKKNKGKKNNKIKMSQAIQAEIKRNNSTSSSPVCQQATMIINAVGKKQRNRIQNSINMYKKRKNHQQHSVNINNANKKIKGNLEDNTSVKQEEKKICLQSNANANLANSCTEHCINTNEERQIHSENLVNVDNEQDSEQAQRNFFKAFVEIGRLREKLDHLEEQLMEEFQKLRNSNSSNLL